MKKNDEGLFQFFSSLTKEEMYNWLSVRDDNWRKQIEVDLRKEKLERIQSRMGEKKNR